MVEEAEKENNEEADAETDADELQLPDDEGCEVTEALKVDEALSVEELENVFEAVALTVGDLVADAEIVYASVIERVCVLRVAVGGAEPEVVIEGLPVELAVSDVDAVVVCDGAEVADPDMDVVAVCDGETVFVETTVTEKEVASLIDGDNVFEYVDVTQAVPNSGVSVKSIVCVAASVAILLPDDEAESLTVDDDERVRLGETLADAEMEFVRVERGDALDEDVTESIAVLEDVDRNVFELVDITE